MYTTDVFVVLTAYDTKNKANSAIALQHNKKWFCKAAKGVAEEPTITSRETTPAEDFESAQDDEASVVDRLVVTFDKLLAEDKPSLENGLQLGSNPTTSHILLGYRGTKGISDKQCNITVDKDLRIWLHDYHSTHGTAVGLNNQNQREVRRMETWIMAYEPGSRNQFHEITVHCGTLAVNVEFPNHAARSPRYIENLWAFIKKCNEVAEKNKIKPSGVEVLDKDSGPTTSGPITEAATNAPTPGEPERLIYYKVQKIGQGTFGHVHVAVRARDGVVFASKTFKPPPNKNKRRRDDPDPEWLIGIRREFNLMKCNQHPNVIQVFELQETPEPMIVMAYCPRGNIFDARGIDDIKYISAFGQILDGLNHLHVKGIVHRDLKPENFLIEMNPFFKIIISDFGLSKITDNRALLRTFCGSLLYMAPEVFPGISEGYGSLADIWSLGAIVLEWIYGSPNPPDMPQPRKKNEQVPTEKWYNWIDIWAAQLLNKLEDQEHDQVVQILAHMLEVDVRRRWPAHWCLAQGFRNGLFKTRVADGRVVCTNDLDDVVLPPIEGVDNEPKTPTAVTAPKLEKVRSSLVATDLKATS